MIDSDFSVELQPERMANRSSLNGFESWQKMELQILESWCILPTLKSHNNLSSGNFKIDISLELFPFKILLVLKNEA